MNNQEILHHLQCLHYKLKYKVFMVNTEYDFMAKVLQILIEKMMDEIK